MQSRVCFTNNAESFFSDVILHRDGENVNDEVDKMDSDFPLQHEKYDVM